MKVFEFVLSRVEVANIRIAAETAEEAKSAIEKYGVDSFVWDLCPSTAFGAWQVGDCIEAKDNYDVEACFDEPGIEAGVLDGDLYLDVDKFIDVYKDWMEEHTNRPPPPDPNQLSLPLMDDEKERK